MAEKQKTSITVVSLNAFGAPFNPKHIFTSMLQNHVRKRFRKIAEFFSKEDIDIISLQEVFTYPHLSVLKKLLPDYKYVLYKKFLYGPRGGVVIFSKIPLVQYSYVDFEKKGAWWNKSLTGPLTRIGVLIAKMQNYPLYVINTHLIQNPDHNWKKENKYVALLKKQLEQLAGIINLLRGSGADMIISGDFNMAKDSIYYHEFIKETGLSDPFESFKSATYQQYFLKEGLTAQRIDYIFTDFKEHHVITSTDHFFTKRLEFDNGEHHYVSDHIGLKLTFSLGKPTEDKRS